MVHYMDSTPYFVPRSPGCGPAADEEVLAGYRRKRTLESMNIPFSFSPYGAETVKQQQQTWTPSSPLVDRARLSLMQPTDSDCEDINTSSPQQSSPRTPLSPISREMTSSPFAIVEEDNTVALAASLLLSLWSRSDQRPMNGLKRAKFFKFAGDDEEAYVPKNAGAARRSKKHVNKDVRIPNSCETHKRRHLKCPLDCEERLRREAEVASGMHDDDNLSVDGEAFGSGSDVENVYPSDN